MHKIKITVMKITTYKDLMEKYENPISHKCDMKEGMEFIIENNIKPKGFCDSAWETLYPYVCDLSNGIGNFFNGWMKNPMSALLSCNDGFRPVSFLIEVID